VTSVVGPRPGDRSLLARLERHEQLLGALVGGHGVHPAVATDLDFVVVAQTVSAAETAQLSTLPIPVVLLVDSDAELAAARAAGVPVTMALGSRMVAADVVLTEDGPARLVTSPAEAQAAFSSGADLVVYDAVAMIDDVLATLPAGRPHAGFPPEREPLVLLSGMLGDQHLWDGVAAGLGDIALPWPARIDLDDSVPEMALSVLAEAPPRFALAGHSLGAIVALEIMRRAPARVTRLALLNASARGASPAQIDSWAQWRGRTEAGEFEAVADELARLTLPPAHRDPELVARNLDMARAIGSAGLLRQLAAQTSRPDSRSSLGAIDVPVLVVSGELDEVCPPELQRELAELCPTAELVTVPEAGHMAPLEQPSRVAAVLLRWLSDVDPPQ